MGLAALHIGQGRELPVFFYGQHYMGTLEAYLAAPLLRLFGTGTVLLRLPLLAIYAAFLFCMYRLTRRVYSPGLAVLTVGLLALGSDRILKNQLIAAGGYPELNLAGALLFLLAAFLALEVPGPKSGRRRLAAVGAWGFVAGLCLWVDWLVLPYLAASAVVLVAGLRRELLGRAGANRRSCGGAPSTRSCWSWPGCSRPGACARRRCVPARTGRRRGSSWSAWRCWWPPR
jgi:hypothetical protein